MPLFVAAHGKSIDGMPDVFVPAGIRLYLYTDFDLALSVQSAAGALTIATLTEKSAARETFDGAGPHNKLQNLRLSPLNDDFFALMVNSVKDGTFVHGIGGDEFPDVPTWLCNGHCPDSQHNCTGLLAKISPGNRDIHLVCCRVLVDDNLNPIIRPMKRDTRLAASNDESLRIAASEAVDAEVKKALADPEGYLQIFDTYPVNSQKHLQSNSTIGRLVEQRTARKILADEGSFGFLNYFDTLDKHIQKRIYVEWNGSGPNDLYVVLNTARAAASDLENLDMTARESFWNGLTLKDKKHLSSRYEAREAIGSWQHRRPDQKSRNWFEAADNAERLGWWWSLAPSQRAQWRVDDTIDRWLQEVHPGVLSAWFDAASSEACADWCQLLDDDDLEELRDRNPDIFEWARTWNRLNQIAHNEEWVSLACRYVQGTELDREIIASLGRFIGPIHAWVDSFVDPAHASTSRVTWKSFSDETRTALSRLDKRISTWLQNYNLYYSNASLMHHNSIVLQALIVESGKTTNFMQDCNEVTRVLLDTKGAFDTVPIEAETLDEHRCFTGHLHYDGSVREFVIVPDGALDADAIRDFFNLLGFTDGISYSLI